MADRASRSAPDQFGEPGTDEGAEVGKDLFRQRQS